MSCRYHRGRAETRQRSTETQTQLLELALCSPLLIKNTPGAALTCITEFCQRRCGQSGTARRPTCSPCSLLASPYLPCCMLGLDQKWFFWRLPIPCQADSLGRIKELFNSVLKWAGCYSKHRGVKHQPRPQHLLKYSVFTMQVNLKVLTL